MSLTQRRGRSTAAGAQVLAAIVVVWLIIGALAAGQRHYFSGSVGCGKTSTIAVTVIAGPLNYVGANPKVACSVPQPSK
jgi:hypothetical protein